ncbi:hypothetical protein ISCGN_008541 [Ixodes scapularis]
MHRRGEEEAGKREDVHLFQRDASAFLLLALLPRRPCGVPGSQSPERPRRAGAMPHWRRGKRPVCSQSVTPFYPGDTRPPITPPGNESRTSSCIGEGTKRARRG